MRIKAGEKQIGDDCPVFIIAEAANNHGGDFDLAKKMVKAAPNMGADAVKLQSFYAEHFLTKDHLQYSVFKGLEFTKEQWIELFETAKENNIIFIVDVNDEYSVDLIDSIGVPMLKIHTGDIVNPSLLKRAAKKKKPLILHAGLVSMKELENAVSIIKSAGNKDIIPMHGWQDYPTRPEHLNINVIKGFVKKFGIAAFADHTTEIIAPIAAVALGAKVIEKHFSLDRSLKNYDWESAAEPDEFKKMVEMIRMTEKMLGSGNLKISDEQKKWLDKVMKHIVASKDIKKGERIKKDMLAYKRSPAGIYPTFAKKIISKKAKKEIDKDQPIFFKDVGR